MFVNISVGNFKQCNHLFVRQFDWFTRLRSIITIQHAIHHSCEHIIEHILQYIIRRIISSILYPTHYSAHCSVIQYIIQVFSVSIFQKQQGSYANLSVALWAALSNKLSIFIGTCISSSVGILAVLLPVLIVLPSVLSAVLSIFSAVLSSA